MASFDLKSFIESQGWSFYGIAPIEEVKAALSQHRPVFDAWEKAGYEADMDYLKRMAEDRFNPEHKLPGVRSAIVLSAWYASDKAQVEQKMCSTNQGKVARYAGGRDYHKVLRKRLDALTEYLKQWNPLVMTYPSVDSGPTVDRVLAEAASLGFFGKNSCIIDPSKGSYFFIATLFTTMDLLATPKRQMPNCGNCTKCMDACPTGAIVKPGTIDARKCISYLTIENRGGIPEELRPKIGNRLFGCDICQEVCPFTVGRAHTQAVKIEALKSEEGAGETLDLREILSMRTDVEFEKKFAGTPIMRAKRRGLLRNACVVAGNSGDRSLVSFLDDFLEVETDPMLREHALWARRRLS